MKRLTRFLNQLPLIFSPGVTLVEVMVALAILTIVILGAMTLFSNMIKDQSTQKFEYASSRFHEQIRDKMTDSGACMATFNNPPGQTYVDGATGTLTNIYNSDSSVAFALNTPYADNALEISSITTNYSDALGLPGIGTIHVVVDYHALVNVTGQNDRYLSVNIHVTKDVSDVITGCSSKTGGGNIANLLWQPTDLEPNDIYNQYIDSSVSIATPIPQARLDVVGNGVLRSSMTVPRDTTAHRPTPLGGMIRYNSTTNFFEVVEGSTWRSVLTASRLSIPTRMLIGTQNTVINGDYNTAIGIQAMNATTTGLSNTAAGFNAFFTNTTGSQNSALGYMAGFSLTAAPTYDTFIGSQAGYSATTGISDTAAGFKALFSTTTGTENTAIGSSALFTNITNIKNTAVGFSALYFNTADGNTGAGSQALSAAAAGGTGGSNSAVGYRALYSNTTGSFNTAIGDSALQNNTTGQDNTAIGSGALLANTTGSSNTATGHRALTANTTGTNNTATGKDALLANTTGSFNTATGESALASNNADGNTADGYNALFANTTGTQNTAIGSLALYSNTTGTQNSAVGYHAQYLNTAGTYNATAGNYAGDGNTFGNNVAIGYQALQGNVTAGRHIAIGYRALQLTTGQWNIAVGSQAGSQLTTGSRNILIGYNTQAFTPTTNDQLNLGNVIYGDLVGGSIAIAGVALPGTWNWPATNYGMLLVVGSGTLATFQDGAHSCTVSSSAFATLGAACVSDQRLKKNIESVPDLTSLEKILQTTTVTFNWKTEKTDAPKHTGFIAQAIEKFAPELIATDARGFKMLSFEAFVPWITGAIRAIYHELLQLEQSFMQSSEEEARDIAALKAANAAIAADNAEIEAENQQIKATMDRIDKKVPASFFDVTLSQPGRLTRRGVKKEAGTFFPLC